MSTLRPVAFVLLFVVAPTASFADDQREMPAQLAKILHWLPANTETLQVANGPFLLFEKEPPLPPVPVPEPALTSNKSKPAAPIANPEKSKASATRFDHLFLEMYCYPLRKLGPEFKKPLGQVKVQLIVRGSRQFRPPPGIGGFLYDGCTVFVLDADADPALQAAMTGCLKQAREVITLSDVRVGVYEMQLNDGKWTFYFARPAPGVLLCATERIFLDDMLKRMKKKPEVRAFAGTLAEWKHFDFKARFWGLRHFGKGVRDGILDSLKEKDPGAIGFVFRCRPNAKPPLSGFYVSSRTDAAALLRQSFDQFENEQKFAMTPREGGVEISPADDDWDVLYFLFLSLSLLGHCANL